MGGFREPGLPIRGSELMSSGTCVEQGDERSFSVVRGGGDLTEDRTLEELVGEAFRELEVSRRRAQMIIANARLEAADICAEARQEAEAITETARLEAAAEAMAHAREVQEAVRNDARVEGLAMAAKESREALALVAHLKKDLELAYTAHLRSAEREILEVVLAIAERVTHLQQQEFRGILGAAVQGVLEERAEAMDIAILVNETDYDCLSILATQDKELANRITSVSTSSAVRPGSCKFRSTDFNLDLCLNRRFEQVRDHLRAQWNLNAPTQGI